MVMLFLISVYPRRCELILSGSFIGLHRRGSKKGTMLMSHSIQTLPQGGDPPDVETLETATATALRMLKTIKHVLWRLPLSANKNLALRYQQVLRDLSADALRLHAAIDAVDIPGLLRIDARYSLANNGLPYPDIAHAFPVRLFDIYLSLCASYFHPDFNLGGASDEELANEAVNTARQLQDLADRSPFFGMASGFDTKLEIEEAICTESARAKRVLLQVLTTSPEVGPSQESFEVAQGWKRLTKRECQERWKKESGTGASSYRRTVDGWIKSDKLKPDENGKYCEGELLKLINESKPRAKSKQNEVCYDLLNYQNK